MMTPKILLVDDREGILESLRKLLHACLVCEARNGKDALALAASERPDLVILDVNLPDMSGVEIMGKLGLMNPKPVVIMLTGDETVETTAKALAAGVFAYVTKPFEAPELLDQVRKGLEYGEKEKKRRAS